MSNKNKIRRILLEESKKYSDRFVLAVIKIIYDEIYREEYEKYGEEGVKVYPDTLDRFIEKLRNTFGTDWFFYHITDKILVFPEKNLHPHYGNPLLGGEDKVSVLESVINFIANYKNSGKKKEYEIVSQDDIYHFLDKNWFKCEDKFFEYVWDKMLGEDQPRNYWNADKKELLWGEIEDEVMSKIEDEEWQEENNVSFDDINREKSYFKSYWHYPLDSLGWKKDDLCQWYKDFMGDERVIRLLLNLNDRYFSDRMFKILLDRGGLYYVVDKSLFL